MMLLTIITSAAIEEELLDWLLMQAEITSFTSQRTRGHGKGHKMNIVEQVTGRREQIVIAVELKEEFAAAVMTQLKHKFKDSGLHYRLIAIAESGQI